MLYNIPPLSWQWFAAASPAKKPVSTGPQGPGQTSVPRPTIGKRVGPKACDLTPMQASIANVSSSPSEATSALRTPGCLVLPPPERPLASAGQISQTLTKPQCCAGICEHSLQTQEHRIRPRVRSSPRLPRNPRFCPSHVDKSRQTIDQ